jgi:hypothetical protein
MNAQTSDAAPKDLLGRAMTTTEQELLGAYRQVLALLEREDELSPTEAANVKEAVSSLWQAVNNLALTDERPPL